MSQVVIHDHYAHKLLQNLKFLLYTDILTCCHKYLLQVRYDNTFPLGKYAQLKIIGFYKI